MINLQINSRWYGAAVACATVLSPGTAQALTCAVNWLQAPIDGARDVPTNTLIWGYTSSANAARPRLLGPEGEIAFEQRQFPLAIAPGAVSEYGVWVPAVELAPNTRYAIEVTYDGGDTAEDVVEQTWFTTGDGPLTQGPYVPELLSSEPFAVSGFEAVERGLSLELSYAGILLGDTGNALGDVSSIADLFLDDDMPPEAPASMPFVQWLTTSPILTVGLGTCMSWPEGGAERHLARFGVMDVAGNFSGWNEMQLVLPSVAEARELTLEHEAEAEAERQARLEAAYEPRSRVPAVSCSVTSSGAGELSGSGARGAPALLTVALGAALTFARRRALSRCAARRPNG